MYLRARWSNAQNGRFNRLDPFFGNLPAPQSLHKYAYVHGDPVNNWDPTGMFGIAGLAAGVSISTNIRGLKNNSDFVVFDAFANTFDGIVNGLSPEQVIINFVEREIQGFLIGYGIGKAIRIGSNVGAVATNSRNIGKDILRNGFNLKRLKVLKRFSKSLRSRLGSGFFKGLNSNQRQRFRNGYGTVGVGEFIPDNSNTNIVKAAHSGEFTADGFLPFTPSGQTRLGAISDGGFLRDVDVEFKILHALDTELPDNARGILRISVDREFCSSCLRSIRKFKEFKPNVKVILETPDGLSTFF